MLLQKFRDEGLLFNTNFLEQASGSGTFAYRGELVLLRGEVADAKGHNKPPVEVMRGAVLMGDDKVKLLIGALDRVELLPTLVEKFQVHFAPDMKALLYVVNIKEPVQVEIAGIGFVLIPLVQGVPWNEVMDELALEKSDLKGLSAADKVMTLYKELAGYKPKYPHVSLGEALSNTTDAVREAWGAV